MNSIFILEHKQDTTKLIYKYNNLVMEHMTEWVNHVCARGTAPGRTSESTNEAACYWRKTNIHPSSNSQKQIFRLEKDEYLSEASFSVTRRISWKLPIPQESCLSNTGNLVREDRKWRRWQHVKELQTFSTRKEKRSSISVPGKGVDVGN